MIKKDVKSCFSIKKLIKRQKIDFDQQAACGSPVHCYKYTTPSPLLHALIYNAFCTMMYMSHNHKNPPPTFVTSFINGPKCP